MGSVLYGADMVVSQYVASRISVVSDRGFGPCRALGVIRGGKLIGGVVFHSYKGHDIEMSAVMDDPRWARPGVMMRLFSYPFIQLGCARMTTITGASNTAARRADEHMGFVQEGVHPKGWDGVEDAVSYGMLRENCRWLRVGLHG